MRRMCARLLTVALVAALAPSGVAGQAPAADVDARIEKLVASISQERLQQLLQKLSSFKTRNTLSDPAA